jgi:DNA polymerase-3 subunit delta
LEQKTGNFKFDTKKMEEVIKMLNDMGNIKPIYFFNGRRAYYIDIVSIIEKKVLSEEEKGFNQTVLYGGCYY